MHRVSLVVLFLAAACVSSTRSESCLDAPVWRQQARIATPGPMTDRPGARKLLVFVHGLRGNSNETWTNANGNYWPELVKRDPAFDDYDIYLYSYVSGVFGDCTRIPDLSSEMETRLRPLFERYSEVFFVAHSMGGLVVREFLLTFRGNYIDKTPAMLFLGVPSGGSKIANRAAVITDCVDDLRLLGDNSLLIHQIGSWEAAKMGDRIRTYCAAELIGDLVDRASAYLLCNADVPKTVVTDHQGLAKPACGNDYQHQILQRAVEDLRNTATTRRFVADPGSEERAALEFWNAMRDRGGLSPAEIDALETLGRSGEGVRLAVMRHAFSSPDRAARFTPRARPVIRAVTQLDARLRNQIAADLRKLPRGDPAIDRAVAAAWNALDLPHPPPPPAPLVDRTAESLREARAELADAFESWPEVRTSIAALLANADGAQTTFAAALARLPSHEQAELRAHLVETMLGSRLYAKAAICPAARRLGALSELTAEARRQLIDGRPEPITGLIDARCFSAAELRELQRFVVGLFEKGFGSGSTAYLYGQVLMALATALDSGEAHEFAAGVMRTMDSHMGVGDEWAARALGGYLHRSDAVTGELRSMLIANRVDCRLIGGHWLPPIVEGLARDADPADAMRLWESVSACNTNDHSLATSNLILIAATLSPRVDDGAQSRIFAEVAGRAQRHTNSVAYGQFGNAWESLVASQTDDTIRKMRQELLRSIETLEDPRLESLGELLAPTLRRAAMDAAEWKELERIAAARTPASENGRRFLRLFPESGYTDAIRAALVEKPAQFDVSKLSADERRMWLDRFVVTRATDNPAFVEQHSDALRELLRAPSERAVEQLVKLVGTEVNHVYEEDARAQLFTLLQPEHAAAVRMEADRLAAQRRRAAARLTLLRYRLAAGCAGDDERAPAIRQELRSVLLRSERVRDLRTAAEALTDCASLPAGSPDRQAFADHLAARFPAARDLSELAQLVDALFVLDLEIPGDRLWKRVDDLLRDDPKFLPALAADLIEHATLPRSDTALRLLRNPALDSGLEQGLVAFLSRHAETPLRDPWQAAEWLAAR